MDKRIAVIGAGAIGGARTTDFRDATTPRRRHDASSSCTSRKGKPMSTTDTSLLPDDAPVPRRRGVDEIASVRLDLGYGSQVHP